MNVKKNTNCNAIQLFIHACYIVKMLFPKVIKATQLNNRN